MAKPKKIEPPPTYVVKCHWCGDELPSRQKLADLGAECMTCQDARYANPLMFAWVLKMLKLRG